MFVTALSLQQSVIVLRLATESLRTSPCTGISTATPLLVDSPESDEDVTLLAYTLRSHLALSSPPSAYSALLTKTSSSEDPTLRAISLLATFTSSSEGEREDVLEQARDLAIELEEVEEGQTAGSAKAVVGSLFVKAGEWVEAVDLLSSEKESLEWFVLRTEPSIKPAGSGLALRFQGA